MTGFYMKCNTMLKGVNLAFSFLTLKMYLPKHNQILKANKYWTLFSRQQLFQNRL